MPSSGRSSARRGELVLALARGLAIAVRHALLRWSSLGPAIHVSPMSLTWLRIHEGEDVKHRAEL